jgi:hypothetical protein
MLPKIEVGKYYKTRIGNKVRVICVDRPNELRPVIAINGEGEIITYGPEGRRTIDPLLSSDSDIVSEWTEKPIVDWSILPRWANLVMMDEHGKWHWARKNKNVVCCDCTILDKYGHFFRGRDGIGECGNIPDEYAPKFSGRWQDSAVERPEGA